MLETPFDLLHTPFDMLHTPFGMLHTPFETYVPRLTTKCALRAGTNSHTLSTVGRVLR